MKAIIIPGFQFAGIHCGIKDDVRKKDLTLIFSEEKNTLIDGVFTKNKVCAPPVDLCRHVVRNGKAQLVVINSGIANACTGKRGVTDSKRTQKEVAKLLGIPPSKVCVSSTGKIGDFLPMAKLSMGLKKATHQLSPHNFFDAVKGIMTTDQYPKFGFIKGRLLGKSYTIAVLAKGAGMLRPNMATMLAYVLTDLKMTRSCLKTLFRSSVDFTLNRVTVDGDTSTNDTVLMLANGRAGNKTFSAASPTGRRIRKELNGLLTKMARQITLDGEGATKCCEVHVSGARNLEDAKRIAYAIGNSPLVKTALFGCDPNWGRIMAAVGYSGAKINQHQINIKIGNNWLVKKGMGLKGAPIAKISKYMRQKNISMQVQCGNGKGKFFVFMSDLTYDYIHLNAEYHS